MRTTKAMRSLRDLIDGMSNELGFLVLSGSFNPIHSGHFQLLDAARERCNREGVRIIAGFLAPSGDDYVGAKLGGQAWPLDLRIRLCALAAAPSDWIDVWDSGQMSGFRICREIFEQIRGDGVDLLAGRSLTGIEVMGSDAAIRIFDKIADDWDAEGASQPWYEGRRVCCFLRPGVRGYDDAAHLESRTSPRAARIGIIISIVDPRAEGFALESVSGTEIRQIMAQNDWSRLSAQNWLYPDVLEFLQASCIQQSE
jgi:hypothetical protein